MIIIQKIEELRNMITYSKQQLCSAIEDSNNLLDPNIIILSQIIDEMIFEYYKWEKNNKLDK